MFVIEKILYASLSSYLGVIPGCGSKEACINMSAKSPLAKQISYHAFNDDGSQCAVSMNNEVVNIYNTNGEEDVTKWKQVQAVTEVPIVHVATFSPLNEPGWRGRCGFLLIISYV